MLKWYKNNDNFTNSKVLLRKKKKLGRPYPYFPKYRVVSPIPVRTHIQIWAS